MPPITQPASRLTRRARRWTVWCAWLSALMLLTATLLLLGAGPAYRQGWVALGTAFTLLRQGAQLAAGAGVLGVITLLSASFGRHWRVALVGALVSLAVLATLTVPMQMSQRAQSVPPIHDISTDLTSPPVFRALAAVREAAPNEVDHPGAATARQQQMAYPLIGPLVIDQAMGQVLSVAEALVRERGWAVAAVTADTIEATATTPWFGFKDDVVIRLTPTTEGVRVDMRSASRLGKSDLGTNAARIHAFLTELDGRTH
ncbi:DUF1499 domain-containing protein [Marinobacter sp. X15-166B]|uniref:DUF1499 domain-containing protein n=1 Tax=Marinobacter sp. X15-166B TaxID=1897620 RepID=UPI00085BCF36|nr:DUF1499 domain-containing protein [Marinobacter sp. X15-166B]OEY65918.1 hypothetical protein BG841_05250 [Marinobacter sp. X15-166B]